MIAVLQAKTSSTAPLIADLDPSTGRGIARQHRDERLGASPCAAQQGRRPQVKNGLVSPIVSTTAPMASRATRRRGSRITGESCEILSRPEKARNAPAYRSGPSAVPGAARQRLIGDSACAGPT